MPFGQSFKKSSEEFTTQKIDQDANFEKKNNNKQKHSLKTKILFETTTLTSLNQKKKKIWKM